MNKDNNYSTIEDNLYLTTVLEQARTRLLDTSRRNRLLNFKESARDVAIIDEMPDQVFEHLVLNGGKFKFNPHVAPETSEEEPELFDEGDEIEPDRTLPKSELNTANVANRHKDDRLQTPFPIRDLERKLRRLYYDHRSIVEETGANNLYLIIGYLEWSAKRDEDIRSRSPLILVPVRLTKEAGTGVILYKLHFDDEALDTNYSLYEKLRSNCDIILPLIEDEQLPENYWDKVTKAISSRNIEGWNVIREMTLGLFRFNKQVMWHDLDPKRWPAHSQLLDKKVIRRILVGPREGDTAPGQYTEEYNQDDGELENKLPKLSLILDADSSQYSALIDAISLEDGLVIEGPPGTGKSQTISNLIAVALEMGLSILFVAEKMAALNVVFNRLEDVGLGNFCLQLHGLKTSKKKLLSSLKDRIQLKVNSPIELQSRESELLLNKKELIEFSKIISEKVGPEEIPLHDIPWLVETLKQKLPNDYIRVKIDNLDSMTFKSYHNAKNLLDDLGKEWDSIPVEARKHWFGFLPDKYKESQSDKVVDLLNSVISANKIMNEWLDNNNVYKFAPSLYQVKRLLNLSELNSDECLPNIPSGIQINFVYQIIHGNLIDSYSGILNELEEYLSIVRKVNDVFDYASDKSSIYSDLLEVHSESLSNVCCSSELTLTDLPKEYDSIREIISTLGSLPDVSKPIIELSEDILRTIDDYKKLTLTADRLLDGPVELSLHSHEYHTKPTVNNYLSLAKATNNELISKTKDLNLFILDNDIETEKVQKSYQDIKAQQDAWFPIFSKEYRQGRKYIRRIMRNPVKYTRKDDFPDNIKRLLEYCKDRDKFKNNDDFKSTLGTLFKGIDTYWDVLEKVINFSQKLREDYGNENAIMIISDWDTHVDSMQSTKDSLNHAFSLIYRYSDSHPFPETLWQRPISEVSRTLKPWEEKLSISVNELIQPWCNTSITLGESIGIVKAYKQARIKEGSIEKHKDFSVLLEEYWEKSLTNLDNLRKLDMWIKGRLEISCINIELLKFIIPDSKTFRSELFPELIQQTKELRKSISNQINKLNKIGQINTIEWIGGNKYTLINFIDKVNGAISTVTYLPLMVRWRGIDKQVGKIGLSEISKSITTEKLNGEHACSAFEYSFYSSLLEKKISCNSLLNSFNETQYKNLRDRFAECDKNILKLNSQKIASKLCKINIPEGVGHGKVANFTENRLIVHEAGKKPNIFP